MKRLINTLTTWEEYEKKLMKDKEFKKYTNLVEHEYVLIKSLIHAREKKHLTQTELAKKIGSKQPVISRIENGTSKPTVSLLEKIANALDAKLIVKLVV
jgi:ribosome-binding protein aMBF1 (putative translation factor)